MCCWRVSECKLGFSTVELWHTLLVRTIKLISTFSTLFYVLSLSLFLEPIRTEPVTIFSRGARQACTVRNDDSRNETGPLLNSHFLWTAKTTDMERERNKCVNSVRVHSLLANFVTVDRYNCVETAAMLVYQPNSVGVEFFSHVSKHLLLFWPC